MTKLTPQAQSSNIVERLIQEFTTSLDICLRQHAFELKHLHENVKFMKGLLPVDKGCEDMVVDASLSFLDGFVAEELSQGAALTNLTTNGRRKSFLRKKVIFHGFIIS